MNKKEIMKKILFTLILISLWAGLSAQSVFRKGIKVGDPDSPTVIEVDSMRTTGVDVKFFNGSTELRPAIDLFGYVIEEIAGVVYARPSAGSTLNAYSGVILSGVLNSCVSQLTTGGKIYIKEGDYADNDTIVINKNNIWIEGGGQRKAVIRAKASLDATKHICDGFIQVTGTDVTIKNLEIDGNAANQTKIDHGTSDAVAIINGIESEDAHRLTIDNIYIHDFTETCIFATGDDWGKIVNSTIEDGFWNGITLGWGTQDWVIDKCIVQGSTPVLGDSSSIGDVGIALYGRNHRVTNNLIKNIVGVRGYDNSKAGISLEFACDTNHLHESRRPAGMFISNNRFEGSGMTSGVANNGLGSGSKSCIITNNYFDSCKYAINFWGDSAKITDNKIYGYQIGSYTYGIYIQEGDYNFVSTNEVIVPTTGSGNYPILVTENSDATPDDGANYNTVTNNTLIGGTYYSIGVSGDDCTGNEIIGNIFDDDTDEATDVYDTGTGTIIRGNYDRNSSRWDALTTGANRPVTYTGDAVSVAFGAADLTTTGGTTTGTLSTGVLQVGDATSNTIISIDSIGFVGTDAALYDGADTVPPYIPFGSREEFDPDAYHNNVVQAYQSLGSGIKALPIDITASNITDAWALPDGYVLYIAVYLPKAATITGVMFALQTTGDYAADNNNKVGLYSVSGETLTKVAESTNDGDLFKGSESAVTKKAFSSTYSAAAGLYYIALLWNTSDAIPTAEPAIRAAPTVNSVMADLDFTNQLFTFGVDSNNTDLPANITGTTISSSGLRPFAAIY